MMSIDFRAMVFFMVFAFAFDAQGGRDCQAFGKAEEELRAFQSAILSRLSQESDADETIQCHVPGRPPFALSLKTLMKVASYDESGNQVKQNTHGSHPVYAHQGAHFKVGTSKRNIHPMHEMAAYFFQKALTGRGVPPSFFMGAVMADGRPIFLQVSQTIEGLPLDLVIRAFTEKTDGVPLKKLEPESLGAFMLTDLIFSHLDVKADNFVVDRENRLFSIDNDISGIDKTYLSSRKEDDDLSSGWASSSPETPDLEEILCQETKERPVDIQPRFMSLFYLYDEFKNQTVPKNLRWRISLAKPRVFMIEWLAKIHKKNRSFDSMRQAPPFIGLEPEGIGYPSSLRYQNLSILMVYHRLIYLHQIDFPRNQRTYWNLFKILDPLNALCVQRHLEDEGSAKRAIKHQSTGLVFYDTLLHEGDYVTDGKTRDEMLECLKRRFREEGGNELATPLELGRLLFNHDPYTIASSKFYLSHRAYSFLRESCLGKPFPQTRDLKSIIDEYKRYPTNKMWNLQQISLEGDNFPHLIHSLFGSGPHSHLMVVDLRHNDLRVDYRFNHFLSLYNKYIWHHTTHSKSTLKLILFDWSRTQMEICYEFYDIMVKSCIERLVNLTQSKTDIDRKKADFLRDHLPLSLTVKTYLKDFENHLHDLVFPWRDLTQLDMVALSCRRFLAKDPPLYHVDFAQVPKMAEKGYFPLLLRLMKNHPEISDLTLSHIPLFLQWNNLLPLIGQMTRLTRLALGCTDLSKNDLKKLIQAVGQMPSLTFLDLSRNDLDTKDLKALGPLLRHPALQTVDVTYNHFTPPALQSLARELGLHRGLPFFLFQGNPLPLRIMENLHGFFLRSYLFHHGKNKGEVLKTLSNLDMSKSSLNNLDNISDEKNFFVGSQNLATLDARGYALNKIQRSSLRRMLFKRLREGDFAYFYGMYLQNPMNIKRIDFSNCRFNINDWQLFAKFLSKSNTQKVKIDHCNLGEIALNHLFRLLAWNNRIRKLDLRGNLEDFLKNPKIFEKSVMECVCRCPKLSKISWDIDFLPQKMVRKVQEITHRRYDQEALDLHPMLETTALYQDPHTILSLFDQLGVENSKLEFEFGVPRQNLAPVLFQKLDDMSPGLFSLLFANEDFFIKRYGLPIKIYRKIRSQKNFTSLLLCQPVHNPYIFMKDGFDRFKQDYWQEPPMKNLFKDFCGPSDFYKPRAFQLIHQSKEDPLYEASKALCDLIFCDELAAWGDGRFAFDQAIQQGSMHTETYLYFKAYSYLRLSQHIEAIEPRLDLFKKAAHRGHGLAAHTYARLYRDASGDAFYTNLYKTYLILAHEEDVIQASYDLGCLCEAQSQEMNRPDHKRQDLIQKAYDYFTMGAQKGHLCAIYRKTLFDMKDMGDKKVSGDEIFLRLNALAHLSHGGLLYLLGQCHEQGLGCDINLVHAKTLMNKARAIGYRTKSRN